MNPALPTVNATVEGSGTVALAFNVAAGRVAPPSPGSSADASGAARNASVIAGAGILLMAALSGFGYFVAVKGLVTPGDAARTATEIEGSEALFRFGIASLLVVAVLDVVVAWALYRVFRPVSEGISMLGCVPKLLGVLIAIAGLGYLFDSFAGVLAGSSPEVSSYTFLGEFLLALWLVIWGRRKMFDEAG